MSSLLNSITIVLLEPSHPGNIGATARAMKNMGLSNLRLVRPREFPSEIATQRASSAADVLDAAAAYDTFDEAIADCERVYACAADRRDQAWPVFTPEVLAEKIKNENGLSKTAIVFGRESTGLTNEELRLAHAQIQIPTHADYNSLNLAQAVQVVCYELYKASFDTVSIGEPAALAVHAKRVALYEAFEMAAIKLEYYQPDRPLNFPTRMRQIITQMDLLDKDADLLLGFLKRIKG